MHFLYHSYARSLCFTQSHSLLCGSSRICQLVRSACGRSPPTDVSLEGFQHISRPSVEIGHFCYGFRQAGDSVPGRHIWGLRWRTRRRTHHHAGSAHTSRRVLTAENTPVLMSQYMSTRTAPEDACCGLLNPRAWLSTMRWRAGD